MSRWARALAAVVAIMGLVSLAGCAGQSPVPTPSLAATPSLATTDSTAATASPAPTVSPASSDQTFESHRHHYRITFPRGWLKAEYEGAWTSLLEFGPGEEVPGEDVIRTPAFDAFLVMNSMAIEDMTPAEWLAAFNSLVIDSLPVECPGVPSVGTLGGEQATVVTQQCDDAVYVGRSLTHAGRGYYFTVMVPPGDDALAAAFDTVVQSIDLLD